MTPAKNVIRRHGSVHDAFLLRTHLRRMTYCEAIDFLYGLRWYGAKFGLENPRRLAALAGHPERRLRFIHVAGTNGKGSVCAFLESIYRRAGYRVGLFTSPHLVRFGERIQVNRQLIPEAEVARLVELIQPWLQQFPPDRHPTFFEVVTLMALLHFEAHHCDVVIWETGMGGRLDATNIVRPLASVITNIHYDHQQWLGSTLSAIAAEKAGILKPGIPALTAAEAPEALDVLRARALQLGCPLWVVGAEATQEPWLRRLALPLPGQHQYRNAALAAATVRVLMRELPVTQTDLEEGLQQTWWPGRFQRVRLPSGTLLVLDGAHNVGAMEVLCATLQERFPDVRPTVILGVMADKDLAGIARIVARQAGRILCVPVPSDRGADPRHLAEICRQVAPRLQVQVQPSLQAALQASQHDAVVTVTGSLYLVGQALESLGLVDLPSRDEKELNNWTSSVAAACAASS
ncbi:MAG: folylpolyglutamate synthase/dihydrofolate synthase family protein [Verrucomicrobiota bacterium]|nr:bifunctional folylpolyglutamate synthase/dihydrofolate synthase [Limisphaera sp.]MDW8381496.1 folylpolyglutamate synthase/dihydrofolate synthase family protein [Verrucomicrobiota bacterium]